MHGRNFCARIGPDSANNAGELNAIRSAEAKCAGLCPRRMHCDGGRPTLTHGKRKGLASTGATRTDLIEIVVSTNIVRLPGADSLLLKSLQHSGLNLFPAVGIDGVCNVGEQSCPTIRLSNFIRQAGAAAVAESRSQFILGRTLAAFCS